MRRWKSSSSFGWEKPCARCFQRTGGLSRPMRVDCQPPTWWLGLCVGGHGGEDTAAFQPRLCGCIYRHTFAFICIKSLDAFFFLLCQSKQITSSFNVTHLFCGTHAASRWVISRAIQDDFWLITQRFLNGIHLSESDFCCECGIIFLRCF